MAEQPKSGFYIAVALVVAALIGFAVYRSDLIAPKPAAPPGGGAGPGERSTPRKSRNRPNRARIRRARRPSRNTRFKPAEKLPPVKGVAAYKPLVNNTVRFALNVWAGWAPIVYANNGFKAGQEWTAPGGEKFKVDLVLIDNPVAMRDAYAAGERPYRLGHARYGASVPSRASSTPRATPRDSRIMPRIYQQVDFSNGGDGIVVRENIKTAADLRGKKMVLAQNSPSHYFALNMLVSGGVQPPEVNMIFTEDAFQAAAAFNSQKEITGCVSWAPDIYNLSKIKGNRMLVTTQDANRLIADVWFARADFAKDQGTDHRRAGAGHLRRDGEAQAARAKKKVSELMAAGYNIPQSDALSHAGRCPQHQLGRELPVLHQPEQPDEFRAHLAASLHAVSPDRLDQSPAGSVRPGDGLLSHSKAWAG